MLITSESSEELTPRCDLYVTYTYNISKLNPAKDLMHILIEKVVW